MRTDKPWLAALLLCGAASLIPAQTQKQATFPRIAAENLDKEKVELPGGLEGQTDLLLISFEPEQQQDIESWMPAAQAVQHLNFQFRYYQLPVAGKENILFRWWETSSLRNDQTDPVIWHWIVPLFVDRKELLKDLQIPDDKQVVALLVDRQGHVLWRERGPLTPDKRASLMAATHSGS